MERVHYELRAYICPENSETTLMFVLYESDSYEDAMEQLRIAQIRPTRPQINLYRDDGETCEKLAVKDGTGIRTENDF